MRLVQLTARLRGRSLAELRERAAQALSAAIERWGFVDSGEPTDAAFRGRLRPDIAAAGLDALARSLRHGPRPSLVPGLDDAAATARFVAARFPSRVDEIVRTADGVLEGRFALLGYPAQRHRVPPQWTHDLMLGVTAPNTHWSRVDFLDPRLAGDHKLVWELNRHQFLVTLGQAWQLTGDARYARGAAALLTSWLDANTPKRGINWASSLEVAYRVIAWIWTMRLIRDSGALSDDLLVRWLKCIELSGRHIERYLSTWFSPNTHLTGEGLGLLYIGTQFPELRAASRWEAMGSAILRTQLARQVRPDGTYFEQATYYHRYTLDIYLHARILVGGRGGTVAADFDPALAVLADFLAWTSRADGTMPLFGDEDGGRLLFLDGRSCDDVRSPLATCAVLVQSGRLAAAAGAPSDELAWMLGAAGVRAYDLLAPTPPTEHARAFPDGGFFTIRDGWSRDSGVLTIDCGPLGMANGGHAHADTLAFDIALGDRPIFVDAGTVSYTTDAAERDAMRSSQVHNTVTLDARSSSEPAGPFQWRQMTAGVCDAWQVTPAGAFFEGHHDGYVRLPSPARHRRMVLAARHGWWLVRDVIESGGEHDAVATFQCASGLDVQVTDETLHVVDDGRPVIAVTAMGAPGTWQLDDGVASRRYGARESAPRARFRFRTHATTAVTFAITRAAAGAWEIVRRAVPQGEAIELQSDRLHDLVLFEAPGLVDGVCTDARVAWIRRRVGEAGSTRSVDSLFVLGGSRLELDGVEVVDAAGGNLSATRGPDGWRVARFGAPPAQLGQAQT